ncbi:MAG: glycosyltransferase family 2 protein, partial [Methylococcales bacterium]
RYFRQDNAGAGAARNRGVDMAQGHWMGFLEAYDFWEPDKLAVQMDVFQKNPNIHMVFGHIQEFYSNDLVETTTTPANKIPGYDCGCLLIRRQHFLEVGLFSRGWKIGEFVDWFSKALDKNFQYLPLPQILYRRRIHSDNLGRRATQWQKDYTSILKLHLDRRRKKANESKEIPPPLLTT